MGSTPVRWMSQWERPQDDFFSGVCHVDLSGPCEGRMGCGARCCFFLAAEAEEDVVVAVAVIVTGA